MKLYSRGPLDPRWTRHHTPVAAGFMLATIKVIRKEPGTRLVYNPTTRTYTGNMTTVLEGAKARIQPFGINGDMVVGQDTTARRYTRVQIEDISTGIRLDDIIQVTACPDNPDMMNHLIEVRGSFSSSNAWFTDLVCEVNQKTGMNG